MAADCFGTDCLIQRLEIRVAGGCAHFFCSFAFGPTLLASTKSVSSRCKLGCQ